MSTTLMQILQQHDSDSAGVKQGETRLRKAFSYYSDSTLYAVRWAVDDILKERCKEEK